MRRSIGPSFRPAGSRAASTLHRAVLAVMLTGVIFISGILLGSQFSSAHEAGGTSAAKPWLGGGRVRSRLGASVAANADAPGASAPAGLLDLMDAASLRRSLEGPLPDPSSWATFSGSSVVVLDGVSDAPEAALFAWVYLSSKDGAASIKTIASTRYGGCKVDDKHRGWSFYVNNWETGDRALVLEWRASGASGEGCGRLSSDPGTIPLDKWVHVGFAFRAGEGARPPTANLFLGGALLRVGPSSRAPRDVQEPGVVPLTLGASGDRQYAWVGRIAHVALYSSVPPPSDVLDMMDRTSHDDWMEIGETRGCMGALLLGGPDAPLTAEDGGTPVIAVSAGNLVQDAAGKLRGVPQGAPAPPRKEGAPPPSAAKPPKPEVKARAAGKSYSVHAPNTKVPASIAKAPPAAPAPAGLSRFLGGGGTATTTGFNFSGGGNQWQSTLIGIPADKVTGPSTDAAACAAGTNSDEVTAEEAAASDELGRTRAATVKAAMQFVWGNYKSRAWGADELKPVSGSRSDNWSGVGMTLLDSLDTLWVMGMTAEFDEAVAWCAANLSFDRNQQMSVFETTIRALGGLLSAYDLSGLPHLLASAVDLGNRLMPAFNSPTGIPRAQIVLANGAASQPGWTGGASILAELGTVQLEFRQLTRITGDPKYARAAEAVIEKMDSLHPVDGLYPIFVSADSGQPTTSQITFGALGDSFYEYLLKVWLQGGRVEPMYRRMYDAAMDGLTARMLKRSTPSNLAYVADWDGRSTTDKMDHLVCFVPGMLALGAATAAGTPGEANAVRDLINAKALAYTCWQMYERQATGIGAEFVEFPGGGDLIPAARAPFYILRPEAAEALFVLHQLTGNPVYREWGWKMFVAIEKGCKAQYGYGAHPDVRDPGRTPDDRMESFFLAEVGVGCGCVGAGVWVLVCVSPFTSPFFCRRSSTSICCSRPTTTFPWTSTCLIRSATRQRCGSSEGHDAPRLTSVLAIAYASLPSSRSVFQSGTSSVPGCPVSCRWESRHCLVALQQQALFPALVLVSSW